MLRVFFQEREVLVGEVADVSGKLAISFPK
jgi:hypothetical protein